MLVRSFAERTTTIHVVLQALRSHYDSHNPQSVEAHAARRLPRYLIDAARPPNNAP